MNALRPCYLRSGITLSLSIILTVCHAQTNENKQPVDKVSHTEPLYIDLVRDLGARKGEKELNIGADFTGTRNYNEYMLLAEYEFAPLNRLALEVETDVSFFGNRESNQDIMHDKSGCLKLSMQYSFLVSPKYKTTIAAGYTQLLELSHFKSGSGGSSASSQTVYNPFLVAAKNWGAGIHTLLYASSLISNDLLRKNPFVSWHINAAFHYAIPGSGHFIGLELSDEQSHRHNETTLRPQMKVKVNPALAIGVVTSLPIHTSEGKGFGHFIRIIYEL